MKRVLAVITLLMMITGLLAACGAREDIVATVGNKDIPVGEAVFLLRELEAMYGPNDSQEGEGNNFDQIVKEAVMTSLTRLYITESVALDKGISLTDEEVIQIDGMVAQYFVTVNPEDLEAHGVTDEDVKRVFELNAIVEKLMVSELADFVVDEIRLEEALAADQYYQQIEAFGIEAFLQEVTVQHVLISTVAEDGTSKSEEEIAAAAELAGTVLEEAKTTENFEALVAEYSDDPLWTQNEGKYTFYRGQMMEEFEEASFAMEIEEVRLIKSPTGFHIIKKLDHTYPEETDIQNAENYRAYLVDQYTLVQRREAFDDLYEVWATDYDVTVYDSVWDDVKTSRQLLEEGGSTNE